jgi:oligopeptide/dipeptide ABC transporter ATP-binding protein
LRIGGRELTPVDSVSFEVRQGEALGLVGESGSGKSLTLRAILGLLPAGASIGGSLRFAAGEVPPCSYDPARVRGRGIAMIFQEPMTSLNPTMRVGNLVGEPLRRRQRLSRAGARRAAIELLQLVGVPDAARRARAWPHELSGGLRQRVMIAAALATDPKLLLCDEPTTALDVCVQDQILGLLRTLMHERGMSLLFVTHDLAVIGELCDRVVVMYAGRVAETGAAEAVLTAPRHPYTDALLRSAPSMAAGGKRLQGIPGRPPDPWAFPPGCRFAPRCVFARDDCGTAACRPEPCGADRQTACIHPEVLSAAADVA